MIYDPITRQSLTLVGRYKPQDHASDPFLGQVKGDYRFAKFCYGETLPGFSGGFPVGHERDLDINSVVADDGSLEIRKVYEAAPEIV